MRSRPAALSLAILLAAGCATASPSAQPSTTSTSSWVVLCVDESEPQPAIALVDTRAGAARILAEPDRDGVLPMFGGWVR